MTSTDTVNDSQKDSHLHAPSLVNFLADQDDATKAKYAAELENAAAWSKPLDMWYADSLVYFGLLERNVETLYRGAHVRGSRTTYRRLNGR